MGIAKPLQDDPEGKMERLAGGAGIIAHLGTDILGLAACVGRSTSHYHSERKPWNQYTAAKSIIGSEAVDPVFGNFLAVYSSGV